MQLFYADVFTVILLLFIITAKSSDAANAAASRGVEFGPVNTAVVAGEPVVLRCRTDGVPDANVRWFEYVTTPGGAMISDGDFVLPGHPNSARYSIIRTDSVTFDLQISATVLADGGLYECQDSNASPPSTLSLAADLVILESKPNCQTTLPPDGIVIEGDYFTMECRVNFQARPGSGIAPLMTWSGPLPFNRANSSTNTSVWSGVGFTVNRTMDSQNFVCVTNFTETGFGGPNRDSTAPTWSDVTVGNQLAVYWAPSNLYVAPLLGSYDIGVEITCYADANPTASYAWQNMYTGQKWLSQSFVTTEEMVGYQTMRCQALNTIKNKNYTGDVYLDVYVNARTTTPTPTTQSTTTPVPPYGPCTDLTGRWEAVNPNASLCLTVDHANDARLIGLYMNGSDTYWLQVTGRTKEGKYEESGWAIIWPSTSIGVSAYAAECYSCYGVDTLVANAISRTTKDSEFCGLPGNIIRSRTYTFKRVPTSWPCSSSAATMLTNMAAVTDN